MLKRLILPCALLFLSAPVWADKFEATLSDFKAANGTEEFFSEAYGYAIFPTVGKGGIGIGGAYGKGRVFAGGSYTGDTSVAQLTIGFQLGGQAYSQIIFFQDKHSFDRFTSGSFEFGAEVSAVALTMGGTGQGRQHRRIGRRQRVEFGRCVLNGRMVSRHGGVHSRQRRADVRSLDRRPEVQLPAVTG